MDITTVILMNMGQSTLVKMELLGSRAESSSSSWSELHNNGHIGRYEQARAEVRLVDTLFYVLPAFDMTYNVVQLDNT